LAKKIDETVRWCLRFCFDPTERGKRMKNNWKKYGNDAHVPAARARASETKRSVSRRPSPQLAKGPNPKTARVRLSPSTARKGGGEAKGREGAGRPDNLLVLIGGGRPAKAACTTVLSPCLQTSATHIVSAKERLCLSCAWPLVAVCGHLIILSFCYLL
jgi:hypothetical protein